MLHGPVHHHAWSIQYLSASSIIYDDGARPLFLIVRPAIPRSASDSKEPPHPLPPLHALKCFAERAFRFMDRIS